MKIAVVGGSGYVGFITGLGFASLGNQVRNIDIDAEKVKMMNEGKSPIYEADVNLDGVLQENLDGNRIKFTTELESAVSFADIVFIAVGTPQSADGEADLSQVIEVAEEMVDYIDEYKVIVMKSTVPVGTIDLVSNILSRKREEGEDFDVVSNPEFLREGKGLYDFYHPSRIVVGSDSERALRKMRDLYSPFLEEKNKSFEGSDRDSADSDESIVPYEPTSETPLVETDIKSAQMIKYASNAFLATRISFINEIAGLCEEVGADVTEVSHGMGFDERIGQDYLDAGIGFGGPCLEKDLRALIKISENHEYEPQFLDAVMERNENQLSKVINKVKKLAGYPLYKKIVTIYGLAFKPGTNDVRTSLSLRVIDELKNLGADIKAHDPKAIEEAKEVRTDIDYEDDPYLAAEQSDAILILTDWPEYEKLDYERIKDLMSSANIVDGRNMLDFEQISEHGFNYEGIGKGS